MPSDDFDPADMRGHSENDHGESEPLSLHLSTVASRCAGFAEALGCKDEGWACGLLHDLGKLGQPGQRRIKHGKGRGVDHWSFGAHRLLTRYGTEGVAAAMCILAHHQGLGRLDEDDLNDLWRLDPWRERVKANHHTFSEVTTPQADAWLAAGNLLLPEAFRSVYPWSRISAKEQAAVMADIRMLFSALVDADFLETEAHFKATAPGKRYERPPSPSLQPEQALEAVLRYIETCRRNSKATEHVVRMRDDLLAACRAAASNPQGIFTLSAPTGTGKTLAMLAFALEHAARHSLRRIVLVVPYLSIIEQTARIYREIFEPKDAEDAGFGPHYILEHHSLTVGPSEEKDDEENDRLATARLLAENWDAPVIITTSVQFFESLFSNRSSACRKLHRLARSVVLFDEVQTFPKELAIPTLATLGHLAERHGCTTVFATATQPAFVQFDSHVKQIGGPGWRPREIVPCELDFFNRAKRTAVHWPAANERISWTALGEQLAGHDRVLCIVNLKRHAMKLVELLNDEVGGTSLYHLSTNLCPAHRERVLADVRDRLDDRSAEPCRLIATQCVEAGVDLDFPTVYRAMGPLEAIAQAAGRCNRNGRQTQGNVHVFQPDPGGDGESKSNLYPPGGYAQAAEQTEGLLKVAADGRIDIDDPAAFARYYGLLYQLGNFMKTEIIEAIKDLDFEEVAKLYRLIDRRAVNLVVPYDRELFDSLRAQAQEGGLSGEWIRRARPLAVSVYGPAERVAGFAEPVPLPERGGWRRGRDQGDVSDEWFFLLDDDGEYYDRKLLGLKELPSVCGWIA
ncbi:MAG: CRISPR-associated endonuclease Cas3'' [Pirellulales bacterium]|nr:CRISPR-associated endonuclease Cas3'' [Pirellulales bacterium]